MKKTILFLILFLALIIPLISLAYSGDDTLSFLNSTAEGAGIEESDYAVIIASIINVILSLIGVLFIGLFIYGGAMWMTAAGNEEKLGKAKKTLIWAVVGIIIIVAAYSITLFVAGTIETEGGNNFDSGTTGGTISIDDSECSKSCSDLVETHAGPDALSMCSTESSCYSKSGSIIGSIGCGCPSSSYCCAY